MLNKPYSVTDKQAAELESILMEFPYLQSARAVYLKGLYNKDSFRYNTELKKTAAYTTDRSVLFDFITTEEFRSIDRKQLEDEENALAAIEVKETESLAATVAPAIDKLEESIKLSIIEAEPEIAKTEPEPAPIPEKLEESIRLSIIESEPEVEEILQQEPEPQPEVPAIETTPVEEAASVENTVPEPPIPSTEQAPTIGSPLKFDVAETHSFAEWLQLSKFAPVQREEAQQAPLELQQETTEKPQAPSRAPEVPAALDEKIKLIDNFIEKSPRIKPVKNDTSSWENLGKTTAETPGLMTETLARVYLEQKKYTKAIQAYEILILKYPEKSAFFADRISEIKDLQ